MYNHFLDIYDTYSDVPHIYIAGQIPTTAIIPVREMIIIYRRFIYDDREEKESCTGSC